MWKDEPRDDSRRYRKDDYERSYRHRSRRDDSDDDRRKRHEDRDRKYTLF